MLLKQLGELFLRGIMTLVLALLAIGLVVAAFYPVIWESASFLSYYSSHWQVVLLLLGASAFLGFLAYLSLWSLFRDLREDVEDVAIDTMLGDGASIVYRTGKAVSEYKQAQEERKQRRAENASQRRPRKSSAFRTIGSVLLATLVAGCLWGGLLWFSSAADMTSDLFKQIFAEVKKEQRVTAMVGTPVKSRFVFGSMEREAFLTGPGSADLKIWIQGPKGKATVELRATRGNGGIRFTRFSVKRSRF